MTEAATTETLPVTGQDIALAARATRAVLDQLLEESGTTFMTWITLNALGSRGGAMGRVDLQRLFDRGVGADEPTVTALLGELQAAGLLRVVPDGAARAELTAEGEARYRPLRDAIGRLTAALYAGLDPDELVTTRNVLVEVTRRANERLGR
jgi:DNA-binding MarR family transcriptional regulator